MVLRLAQRETWSLRLPFGYDELCRRRRASLKTYGARRFMDGKVTWRSAMSVSSTPQPSGRRKKDEAVGALLRVILE